MERLTNPVLGFYPDALGSTFLTVGTKTWFGALFGVQATGFGALVIHGAQAGLRMQKMAVTTCAARHGEDVVLGVVVVDQLGFEQALGDQFVVYIVYLKGVDEF